MKTNESTHGAWVSSCNHCFFGGCQSRRHSKTHQSLSYFVAYIIWIAQTACKVTLLQTLFLYIDTTTILRRGISTYFFL